MLVSNFLLKIPRFTGVLSRLKYTWRIQDSVFLQFYLKMNDFIITAIAKDYLYVRQLLDFIKHLFIKFRFCHIN